MLRYRNTRNVAACSKFCMFSRNLRRFAQVQNAEQVSVFTSTDQEVDEFDTRAVSLKFAAQGLLVSRDQGWIKWPLPIAFQAGPYWQLAPPVSWSS